MNEKDNYNAYTTYFPLLLLLYIHQCVYEPLHCVISVSHGRRKINEFDYFRRSTVSNIQNSEKAAAYLPTLSSFPLSLLFTVLPSSNLCLKNDNSMYRYHQQQQQQKQQGRRHVVT